MMTREQNEQLTQVGPTTPMGDLLRRYWHIVGSVHEMQSRHTMRVRLLGEDLILVKNRRGNFGLISEFCPHRRASLFVGIPTDDGIRCAYHGWHFDLAGHCLERPNERNPESLKDRKVARAYPVEELGGLLFGYLGPEPIPLLPRLDAYAAGGIRAVGKAMVPCNWLQIMENSCDPVHTEWLHGKFYEHIKEQERGLPFARRTLKIGFDEFDLGLVKRRLMEGQSEDCDDWRVGHPLVFPTTLSVGSSGGHWRSYEFQIRVPMDDTHTMHYWYESFVPPEGQQVAAHLLDTVPVYEPPLRDENGEFRLDIIDGQDAWVWVSQGPIFDRTTELLGATDSGVTMYRQMLFREMEKVARGEDPIGVIRDPARNKFIELPTEKDKDMFSDGFANYVSRKVTQYSPVLEELLAVYGVSPPPAASEKVKEPAPVK